MYFSRRSTRFIALAAVCCTPLWAVEPQNGGMDERSFMLQGEYVGQLDLPTGKKKLGGQVIARGNDQFQIVWYDGGLPGNGWNKGDPREGVGKTDGGIITFRDGEYLGQLKASAIVVMDASGVMVGELKKVLRTSPTLGAKPTKDAVVLFDGTGSDQFEGGRMTNDALLMEGATSKRKFQSGTLHLEFRVPFDPLEPARGNSGCYLQGRYELQILNSFGRLPHHHECGGIPGVMAPSVNMSYPPGRWQTYDVKFTAATYKDSKKEKNARITVRHNGVLIHDDVEIPNATQSSPLAEGPESGPINLQDHGSPVRYRNIWFVENE